MNIDWHNVPLLKEKRRMSGILPRLTQFEMKDTLVIYLCSSFTDYITTGLKDIHWGCGYRNCQMLLTFLENQFHNNQPLAHVLDIQGIQTMLEKAWKEGFDSIGADQLNHQLLKTKKWIGTTEVYTLLTYLGIRSTILDFHNHRHHALFDWIQTYFMESGIKDKTKTVYMTERPPLYLQHQGHSRTVVGIEVLKSGKRNLLMFDPGKPHIKPFHSIRSFRVHEKSLGRHEQYQILVLGHVQHEQGKMTWDSEKSFLLNDKEREQMKYVTSLAVK